MKRFISFSVMGIIAVLFAFVCGVPFVQVDTVTEDAKVQYGSCETHLYGNNGEYTMIGEATCDSTATKHRTCIVCGYIDRVEIPKNPDKHSENNISDIISYDPKPTCVSGGVQYRVCYGCNKAVNVVNVDADPSAHESNGKYVILTEETCSTVGEKAYKCVHCDAYFDNEEIPVNSDKHVTSENSKGTVTQLPTCAKDGTMVMKCDLCGSEAETKAVPATKKHTPAADWTIDKEANCSADGVKSRHCTVCDTPCDKTAIPSVPGKHTFADEYSVDKEATCVSTGMKSKHCLYCDEKKDSQKTDKNPDAHLYSDKWVITKNPTCSSTGLKHKVCTLCNKKSASTMIEKTAHKYPQTYEIIKESADGLSAQVKYTCTVCKHEKLTIVTFGVNYDDGYIGDSSGSLNKIYKIIPNESSVIKVDYDKQIISNVARNMTIKDFTAKFKNSNVFVIYDDNNNFMNEEQNIVTGCRLNYETPDGKVTNYYVSVTGDLNSDGKITAADARLVLRAAAKLEDLTPAYYTAADVNLDGKVTAADARNTLRVAANLEYFKETYEK